MCLQNEYVLNQLNKDAYHAISQEAHTVRLLREAGLIKPSRFFTLTCRGAACLGHLLVALGRRLENLPAHQPVGAD